MSRQKDSVKVTVYDAAERRSYCLTVYTADSARRVAERLESALGGWYATTSLSDRRHRRR